MTQSAKNWAVLLQEVMQTFGDIRLAYGESDEYSFIFSKTCTLYGGPQDDLQADRPLPQISASHPHTAWPPQRPHYPLHGYHPTVPERQYATSENAACQMEPFRRNTALRLACRQASRQAGFPEKPVAPMMPRSSCRHVLADGKKPLHYLTIV